MTPAGYDPLIKTVADGGGLSSQCKAQRAQTFEGAGDLVAGLEPDLLFLGLAEDHALRRAGEDDVARLQRPMLGNVGNLLLAIEDEVVGVPVLAGLAIDRGA